MSSFFVVKMERRPKIDPDLYDMACAWGIVPKAEQTSKSLSKQDADGSGSNSQPTQSQVKVFPDGKRLCGRDLGAKDAFPAAPIIPRRPFP